MVITDITQIKKVIQCAIPKHVQGVAKFLNLFVRHEFSVLSEKFPATCDCDRFHPARLLVSRLRMV